MSNKTIINPICMSNATVVNCEIVNCGYVARDTVLCDKYKVTERLNINTGEADFYLCSYRRKKYVAKIYRRKSAIKPEIADVIKQIDSPYVSKIYDTGMINGFPFEILPYYKNGSLQGKAFSFEELKNNIIPCINNGKIVCTDERVTTGIATKLNLKLENGPISANGRDVAVVSCYCTDAEGREVPTATPFVRFNTNKLGKILGTGSDVCDHIPVTESDRRMRAGRITIAVEAGETAGTIKLYAESDGLCGAVLDIQAE